MRLLLTFFIATWTLCAQAGTDTLQQIIDEHWAWHLQQSPETLTYRGERSGNDRWTDRSLEAMEQRYRQRGEFLQRLEAIDPETLSADDQLNQRMLARSLRSDRKAYELGLPLMDMNMRDGPQHQYQISAATPFDNIDDYRMWLSRLGALPTLLQQETALLQEGIKRQRVQPRVVIERIPEQISKITGADIEDNPFYRPFLEMPEAIAPEQAETLRKDARELIANRVNPAYAEFRDFLLQTYLPACREQPGIGALPGGKAIYEFLASDFTTTTLTPQEIHELGKREVARILEEMQAIKDEVGFKGDLQAFNNFLRTDPQFYYETPEELFQAYLAVSKRLDPELVKLFGKLPRMPYGVRPIPAESAPDTTTAYYMRPADNGTRAGYYYVNLYRPEVRPKYEMEVLSVHEAVPGHHLQIALAQELEELPEFRKDSSVTAFVEGWALYSEQLGYQMGLYQDPYSRYGQLTYDMWRAVRLVVDTGIHYFGWSRQRAIDYFKANAGKTEADIINEIDRYIGWPGQALAYKIGQLKIMALRADAEQALGANFDIRSFHDELLGAGAIPLDALEIRMDSWLTAQQQQAN
ncbi:DUF885 domain-containing protein [Pseudohalioglobus sediminis]|uniref:DUF885 domain-containing protein n=1 Tax=Pseudohalioglobus sediminis TaxID=2606449 RepID=A0A5B0X098_9GAMM|nr:DUF885 domain-containing protein [Pseudohalioglobus sediminis]KAA1192760.1 DUF885 domain-containing protein [Pseudohalioglobus sediminis]